MSDISEVIINRLKQAKVSYNANDYIGGYIDAAELTLLQQEVKQKAEALLRALIIDIDNDHNTKDTACRLAKMYVNEIFAGRFTKPPEITEFPNTAHLDEMCILNPIKVRSVCSHHFVPIIGELAVGIVPSEKIIGISKFARLAEWIFSRGHIQEEAVIMLADKIEELIEPQGLAIVLKAQHFCMAWRGVKQCDTLMTNSVMRGVFRANSDARREFLSLIKV